MTKKKDLTFSDPPPDYRKNRSYDWDGIGAELKSNPGRWALLEKQGRASVANAIREGKISNFLPAQGFEMKTADNDFKARPRTCDIYVRYNPSEDLTITVKERQKIAAEARRLEKEKQDD